MVNGTQGAANVAVGNVRANTPALSRRSDEGIRTPKVWSWQTHARNAPIWIDAFAEGARRSTEARVETRHAGTWISVRRRHALAAAAAPGRLLVHQMHVMRRDQPFGNLYGLEVYVDE